MAYLIGLHVKLMPLYPSEVFSFLLSFSSAHPTPFTCWMMSVLQCHILRSVLITSNLVSPLLIQYDCSHLTMASHLILYIQFTKCHFDFNHILCSSLIHSKGFLSALWKLILNIFCFKTLCAIQCLACSTFIFLQKIQYKAMWFKSQSLKFPSAVSQCRCLLKLIMQYELRC